MHRLNYRKPLTEQKEILEKQTDELRIQNEKIENLYNQLKEQSLKEVQSKYDKYITEGNYLKAQSNYSEAIVKYQLALDKIRPYQLDSSLATNGINECERLSNTSSNFGQLINAGNTFLSFAFEDNLQNYNKAIQKYKAALATNVNNSLAQRKINDVTAKMNELYSKYMRNGETLLNANDKAAALKWFEKAIILKNNSEVQNKINQCKK